MDRLNKAKEVKTTTYEVESRWFKDFYVDIQEDTKGFRAYLSHRLFGNKKFMFGATKGTPSEENFMDTLNSMIDIEIYKYIREDTHFEEEYRDIYGCCDCFCDEEE